MKGYKPKIRADRASRISQPETVATTVGSNSAIREKGPLWNPEYQYTGKKAYGLYSEEEASKALHPAWRNVQRLSGGFSPESVAANRPYAERDEVWDGDDLRQLYYAGYLYRVWLERRDAG